MNAVELDPVLECRRINFLHRVGDYAGRFPSCLRNASEACGSHLSLRVCPTSWWALLSYGVRNLPLKTRAEAEINASGTTRYWAKGETP